MYTMYQFNSQKTMTVIELSEADIEKFKLFMEHYEKIAVLLDADVFNQKKCTVALNFDHNGTLNSVQRADFLYTREKK